MGFGFPALVNELFKLKSGKQYIQYRIFVQKVNIHNGLSGAISICGIYIG